jgi:hypothetical protein
MSTPLLRSFQRFLLPRSLRICRRVLGASSSRALRQTSLPRPPSVVLSPAILADARQLPRDFGPLFAPVILGILQDLGGNVQFRRWLAHAPSKRARDSRSRWPEKDLRARSCRVQRRALTRGGRRGDRIPAQIHRKHKGRSVVKVRRRWSLTRGLTKLGR